MKKAFRGFIVCCIMLTGVFLFTHAEASVIFILDGSGSMWEQIEGRTKIEIAREVIYDILKSLDADENIGLVVYGHRRKGDCNDIETLIPPGKLDLVRFRQAVNSVVPKGKTPLTAAVRKAAEDLRFNEEKATVILISDGMETCNADPCAAARELEKKGIDFTVHVIGFDLAKNKGINQLQCLADSTGGEYFTARNASALRAALSRAVEKSTGAAMTGSVKVPGTACLFLAGLEDGGVSKYGDSLPKVAPVAVAVPAGAKEIHFDVSGQVGHCPGCRADWEVNPDEAYLAFGVSTLKAPINSLIGVFIGRNKSAGKGKKGSEEMPRLGEAFFIHHYNGTTRSSVKIPEAARMLYLGTMDGYGWYNNDGEYLVRYRFSSDTFSGYWETNEGNMTLQQNGNNVRGTYQQDQGRLLMTAEGLVLKGFWVEKDSDKTCSTSRDGSLHWGRAEFTFDGDYMSFKGWWSYCDSDKPFRQWTGKRIPLK